MICCGTSPLRCSAKLSWVRTATELMAGLRPPLDPGEPLQGARGRCRAAAQGRAQPRAAPLHQRGRCEGPPRLRLGCPMENRPPAQDGADPGSGRQVQRRDPVRTPAPHGVPEPQPQIHPRGSENSCLSYLVNLLSPHLLTLIKSTKGQELLGDVGEQPPCSGDEGDSTGWQCGHLPAVGGTWAHGSQSHSARVEWGTGEPSPTPGAPPHCRREEYPVLTNHTPQGFYATEAKKIKRVKSFLVSFFHPFYNSVRPLPKLKKIKLWKQRPNSDTFSKHKSRKDKN